MARRLDGLDCSTLSKHAYGLVTYLRRIVPGETREDVIEGVKIRIFKCYHNDSRMKPSERRTRYAFEINGTPRVTGHRAAAERLSRVIKSGVDAPPEEWLVRAQGEAKEELRRAMLHRVEWEKQQAIYDFELRCKPVGQGRIFGETVPPKVYGTHSFLALAANIACREKMASNMQEAFNGLATLAVVACTCSDYRCLGFRFIKRQT